MPKMWEKCPTTKNSAIFFVIYKVVFIVLNKNSFAFSIVE